MLKIGLFVLVAVLTVINLSKNPLLIPPQNQLERTQEVAKYVIAAAEEKPFNFALISSGNSDHAYRFFLETKGYRPLGLEEQVTNQLIIICEKPEPECKPLGNSLWEIAGFGRSEVNAQVTVNPGITIYRMVHYYGQ